MPNGHIIVADDDAAIRTVLNQALSRAGYEVRSTGNCATLWRWVAGYTPVQYLPPTPLLVLLLIGPLAILLVNVLAVLPARRSALTQVAAVLRAE